MHVWVHTGFVHAAAAQLHNMGVVFDPVQWALGQMGICITNTIVKDLYDHSI